MKGTILEKILEKKRRRVAARKSAVPLSQIKEIAAEQRAALQDHRLSAALADRSRINIIAEFKRASPSKGVINSSIEPAAAAQMYQAGGAAAISVLTEEDLFQGSMDDLRTVHETVDLPILCKDFIFDPYQLFEAAAAGAAAILLIAAMLDDDPLAQLREIAGNELGLDALVEVHTLDELERVKKIGATLIGINNRNLKTFEVSLDVSRELIQRVPENALIIAESGLQTSDHLIELHDRGFSGFLIGETLMRADDPIKILTELRGE